MDHVICINNRNMKPPKGARYNNYFQHTSAQFSINILHINIKHELVRPGTYWLIIRNILNEGISYIRYISFINSVYNKVKQDVLSCSQINHVL